MFVNKMERPGLPLKGSIMSVLVTLTCLLFCLHMSDGLFVHSDMKYYECQEGWVKVLPENYNESMAECDKDKSAPVECRKHCLARKMGLILDGKMWLFKLVDVLGHLFPGQPGKDSIDKMTDVIMECSDRHYKSNGPMTPYRCYREKKMWNCILKAAEAICEENEKRYQEKVKEHRKHTDSIVGNGTHGEKMKGRQIVLGDEE